MWKEPLPTTPTFSHNQRIFSGQQILRKSMAFGGGISFEVRLLEQVAHAQSGDFCWAWGKNDPLHELLFIF